MLEIQEKEFEKVHHHTLFDHPKATIQCCFFCSAYNYKVMTSHFNSPYHIIMMCGRVLCSSVFSFLLAS